MVLVATATARLLISPTDFTIRRARVVRKVRVSTSGGYWESEASALERELLVFMKNSRNPNEFPTKKHLLDAGRLDLVNAVVNTGGWLAFGWDWEDDYSHSATSLQTLPQEDTGVHAILTRLEKHRTFSFHIHMDKNKHASTNHNGGCGFTDFNNKDFDPDKIRSRLQQMQLQLSSAIHLLRSKTSEVHETHGSELQQLSDVWEFQENEVMKAGDKLRSIRAKLAVLEGKIALSLIDTQKLVEEKQRRIDNARTTLQLLRSTCIFWTHSASEVLLVGSFDGWTSQVKMEKTRTGVFSTSLKLYPGRYEIKFIVDGIWRVDPMLPVVHNNGYENNSLIVHESA